LVRRDAAVGASDLRDHGGPWFKTGNLSMYVRRAVNATSILDRERLLQRVIEEVLLPLACVRGQPARRAARPMCGHARRQPGAVVTRLNRRDVDRISPGMAPRAVQSLQSATQVFTRWPVSAMRVYSPRDTCPTPGDVASIATRPARPMWIDSVVERALSAIAP
jgi:hypothetical protein